MTKRKPKTPENPVAHFLISGLKVAALDMGQQCGLAVELLTADGTRYRLGNRVTLESLEDFQLELGTVVAEVRAARAVDEKPKRKRRARRKEPAKAHG
jgi:hypothetical protein